MKRKYLEKEVLLKLKEQYPDVVQYDEEAAEPIVMVNADSILDVMKTLRDDYNFDMLSAVTAIDYPENFQVAYDLASRTDYKEVMVKVLLDREKPEVESMTQLWPEIDFQEREEYDLMGITFLHHPNLTRIMMPDDFVGHPLRKDFKQAARDGETK